MTSRDLFDAGAIESRDSKECIVSGGEQHATFLEQVAIKVCFEMPNALGKENRELRLSSFDKFSTRMKKDFQLYKSRYSSFAAAR